jgi:hypothetical protein
MFSLVPEFSNKKSILIMNEETIIAIKLKMRKMNISYGK